MTTKPRFARRRRNRASRGGEKTALRAANSPAAAAVADETVGNLHAAGAEGEGGKGDRGERGEGGRGEGCTK